MPEIYLQMQIPFLDADLQQISLYREFLKNQKYEQLILLLVECIVFKEFQFQASLEKLLDTEQENQSLKGENKELCDKVREYQSQSFPWSNEGRSVADCSDMGEIDQ